VSDDVEPRNAEQIVAAIIVDYVMVVAVHNHEPLIVRRAGRFLPLSSVGDPAQEQREDGSG
jgi:hypothetical protein